MSDPEEKITEPPPFDLDLLKLNFHEAVNASMDRTTREGRHKSHQDVIRNGNHILKHYAYNAAKTIHNLDKLSGSKKDDEDRYLNIQMLTHTINKAASLRRVMKISDDQLKKDREAIDYARSLPPDKLKDKVDYDRIRLYEKSLYHDMSKQGNDEKAYKILTSDVMRGLRQEFKDTPTVINAETYDDYRRGVMQQNYRKAGLGVGGALVGQYRSYMNTDIGRRFAQRTAVRVVEDVSPSVPKRLGNIFET